jgi:hypothetical protein
MTELHRLPPDQRAVLSLVLDRGKSYAEVASMLSIPEAAVRERAHAALDALAANGVPPAPAAPTLAAADAGDRPSPGVLPALGAPGAGASPAVGMRPTPSARDGRDEPPPGRPSPRSAPGARRRGALLLAGIAVAIVVAVVLLVSGGNGSGGRAASGARTGTTSTTNANKPRIDKKLTLAAVEPESNAHGEAYVLSDGNRRAFYVAARSLPASQGFFYAVWLYNSPSSSAPLGRAPAVGSNGRLEGGGPLPTNASDYAKLILTRETDTHARHPGTIVLSGSFSLH